MTITSREKVPPLYHGVLREVPSPRHVLVIGGGLAGASAATVLAERGVTCTIVEPLSYLGGRAGAWTEQHDDGSGSFQMERGFHAFFRQYYNLRGWLQRIDPDLSLLNELPDYPVIAPDGTTETFAYVPRDPVFNFAGLINGSATFKWRHLLRANIKVGLSMVAYDGERTYARWDGMSAKEYLDKVHLPRKARAMLFDVFAHSFFNPEEEMSAAEMIQYFHFYFMSNPEGLAFDTLDRPLSEAIWTPFQAYLEARGATILTMTAVARLEPRQGAGGAERWVAHVTATGEGGATRTIEADAVVLAANVHGCRDIIAASPDVGDHAWRGSIAQLEPTAPYAVLRLWFDGDLGAERAPFVSVADAGILDSIGLYHRLAEPEAAWAHRTGGAVVELHAYAVPRSHQGDEERIARELLEGLAGIYPEVRGLTEVQRRFHVMQDCPAFPVGGWERRPRTETPHRGLVMAGDLCWVPLPVGLMERAVTSGYLAANCLLSRWNVRGETLWSVPRRGILAPVMT